MKRFQNAASAAWQLKPSALAVEKRERTTHKLTVAHKGQRAFEKTRLKLISSGLLGRADGRPASIAMVSRVPGEGVTTVCVGLACAIAATGCRVLLIDAYANSTRAHLIPRVNPSAADRPEKVEFAMSPPAKVDHSAFDALVVTGPQQSAAQWTSTWARYESAYDVILVDTGSFEDETVYRWRCVVRHMVLVLDSQRATYETVERLNADLQYSGLRLSGFIMNRRSFPIPATLYRLFT